MIKVIAFDYGGVIETSSYDVLNDIIKLLGVEKEEWKKVYFTYNHLSNVGNSSWGDLILFVARQLGATSSQEEEISLLLQKQEKTKKLNEELLSIIRKLKETYKIVLLSNYSTELRGRVHNQHIDDVFDELIISGEVGIQKPDPKIFSILCEKLQIDISELMFVDDTPRSLEGAEEIGYTPVLYKDNDSFMKVLNTIL